MRTKFLYLFLMFILVFPSFLDAQMKTTTPLTIKSIDIGKIYWCAEVEDIFFSKEPEHGQKLSVGVRIRFTQKKTIPGIQYQKICNCAFEGPSGLTVKSWSKTMSLRLIGIKYSENETNILEHYGPTPAFPTYHYSGFPVIGFVVTEKDLQKGYIDVWGWVSKEPLQCKDSAIYASFAIYNNQPYKQQNECHPHPDFKKIFHPKCLEVSKIPEDRLKKSRVLRIPQEKFLIEKLPPIKFIGFQPNEFARFVTKDKDGKEVIILKEKTIWFNDKPLITRKTKIVDFQKFLKEVNEIEEGLNKLGYSLRDNKPIKIKYIYPREHFKLQKEMISKDFLKKVTIPLPTQVTCEGYSEGKSELSGRPKDPAPFNWEWKWDESFGNEDFGVKLVSFLNISGQQDDLNINPFFRANIMLFGKKIEDILKIDKIDRTKIKVTYLTLTPFPEWKNEEYNLNQFYEKELFKRNIGWNTEFEFPVGPINIKGEIGFKGIAKIDAYGLLNLSPPETKIGITPFIELKTYGELGASYEIVSAGIGGEIILIKDILDLSAELKFMQSSKAENYSYFLFSVNGTNDMTLLSGNLYVWGEIDYLIGSKKFEIEFYSFDGLRIPSSAMFDKIINKKIYAEKDHRLWLKIDKIYGITPYTPKNEKLYIEPVDYYLSVNIDGKSYTKLLKDYNRDGIWGNAIGEYEGQIFEIPLLSYKKIPISIEVLQRYKIGTLEFKNTLDFAKGIWEKIELCYDPATRTFIGTKSGSEDEEITSIGDTSYWGERNHGIKFKLNQSYFKLSPSKAK